MIVVCRWRGAAKCTTFHDSDIVAGELFYQLIILSLQLIKRRPCTSRVPFRSHHQQVLLVRGAHGYCPFNFVLHFWWSYSCRIMTSSWAGDQEGDEKPQGALIICFWWSYCYKLYGHFSARMHLWHTKLVKEEKVGKVFLFFPNAGKRWKGKKTVKTMMILIVVCAAQANFETLEETAKENRRRVFLCNITE